MKTINHCLFTFFVFILTTSVAICQNVLQSTGNAGVGTTSPIDKLEVVGGIHTSGTAAASKASSAFFDYASGGARIGILGTNTSTNGTFSIETYRSNASNALIPFYINPSGNIGLNTTSPGRKLDVNGDANIATNLMVGSGIYNANYYAGNSTATYFKNYGGTTNLTLLENGNLGIGIVTPVDKFEVSGGIHTSGSAAASKASEAYFDYLTGGARIGIVGPNTSTNGSFTIETYRSNNSNYMAALYINPGGNVGLGTTTPSEKLSVDGNTYINGNISANGYITTKKITVTQLGWSDYVFHKDYKLRSLSSLEAFIKQNKHLPEVPSAKEVEENGISVGDNQALLLKKIEELTLYVIELKKENLIMKRKFNDLEKQVKK